MNIVKLRPCHWANDVPMVVFVDMQREYVSDGRAFRIYSIDKSIENCSRLLELARQAHLPIAHFRMLSDGHFFNAACCYSHWIEGFEPRASEIVYDRDMPSCYSNESFCNLIESVRCPRIIYAGMSGRGGLLSTAIDGFHRGVEGRFLQDCSATLPLATLNEEESHAIVYEIIADYAKIADLESTILEEFGGLDPQERLMG